MGNGDPGLYLSFIMLNTKNLKFYTLKYTGENSLRSGESVDGDFEKNKALESNKTVYNELYQFAAKNTWIYKPTEEEKDINFYKNFEQKWFKDNDHGDTENSISSVITSTYYTENLFKYNGNYDNDQVIENADYKIVTYFRNNIIGYDKNKKLYFPIIVESYVTGCDKEIQFVSENEIEVSHEMNIQENDTIDLHRIKFTNSPQ